MNPDDRRAASFPFVFLMLNYGLNIRFQLKRKLCCTRVQYVSCQGHSTRPPPLTLRTCSLKVAVDGFIKTCQKITLLSGVCLSQCSLFLGKQQCQFVS